MICYASVGGSGVVATELGIALASRGHEVHFFSAEPPFRLTDFHPAVRFHQVHTPSYPLFREPQYLLSLANKVVNVARECPFDIIHAHYAIPHATAAFLAREVMHTGRAHDGDRAARVVTTLHGTDITLVGSDESYSEIVAFSIDQSDVVTAVSHSLRDTTYRELNVTRAIDVIPNFIDCSKYSRLPADTLRRRFTHDDSKIVIHISNFRPVKRVDAVVRVFDRIHQRVPSHLLLVGDGPELATAIRVARECGVGDRVHAVGTHQDVVPLLSISDVFLLPSAQESFGLAALEAMACGVPVVASNVGGLPEVISHGVTGFLHDLDDLDGMAASARAVLTDNALRRAITSAAVARVRAEFCEQQVVPMYERAYERAIS